MRASKALKNSGFRIQDPALSEMHISGAEGLYSASDIQKAVKKYLERALNHPKGKADKVFITVEEMRHPPVMISALPVSTVGSRSPSEAKHIIMTLLRSSGISGKSLRTAFTVVKKGSMRGAAFLTAETGRRLDPDRERGVRVSRLGITEAAGRMLSLKLSRYGINTDAVKEALILASKVMSHESIIAELCISDDPDYTTGYISCRRFGYMRIPHIKTGGSRDGGRIFFLEEDAEVEELISYLEKKPVIINRLSIFKGEARINEIAHCTDK
jgi:6-carboxyhexanoate--CoA ligase